MLNFRIKILLSSLVVISCSFSVLYGMKGAQELVLSCVKHAKSKVLVPINAHNVIELYEGKKPLNADKAIRKIFDSYWGCPRIVTKSLQESIVTLLYAKKEKNALQRVFLTHYNTDEDAFSAHLLGLSNCINHLNNEIGGFEEAQFVVIYPVDGPQWIFSTSDQLQCRRQSNELQELAKTVVSTKGIKIVEKPYVISLAGMSPLEVALVLSLAKDYPSRWSIDTCVTPSVGFMTEFTNFVDDAKE